MTNRANTICLLEILKEYSDADHIMQMQEIIAKMKALNCKGNVQVIRRAQKKQK